MKTPIVKKPATIPAQKLRAKLEALAARGVNGEATAAQKKLARLLARYDWSKPATDLRDLFKGVFITTTQAEPVAPLDSGALDIASFAKWAIETRCKVPCMFKAGQLYAQTNPQCARQLASIVKTISDSFTALWTQMRTTQGVTPADRANFMLGLYEGMMNEERHGEAVPKRIDHWKPARAKAKAVAHAAGISLHPYSVAVTLGKQITLCVPLEEVSSQLTNTIAGAIPETTTKP